MQGGVLGPRDTGVTETDKTPCPGGADVFRRTQRNDKHTVGRTIPSFVPARMATKRGGWCVMKSGLEEGRRFCLQVAAQEKPDVGVKAGTMHRRQDVTVWGLDL